MTGRAGLFAIGLLLACTWTSAPGDFTPLRIGTSGDYRPFSFVDDRDWVGFDLELARAYARDRGLAVEFVRFRWPMLLADLRSQRFEIAMSGVTIRPERSLAGRFSVPVATTGALALVRLDGGVTSLDQLDTPARRLAVNAGGHLERVTRGRFPTARILAVADNSRVPELLLEGQADAAITDSLEAPAWMKERPLRALGPFTRDLKAYLWHPEQGERARDLDDWLLAREADGSLARLREQRLGREANAATATPLVALLAALDERLDLMPLVAEAKRRLAAPVRVPAREARVIEAALAETHAAARRLQRPPPPDEAVAELFRQQIAAAREIQDHTLARPAAPGPTADLEASLRPALLRIGARIAALSVQLPEDLSPALARSEADRWLSTPGMSDTTRERLISALVTTATAPRGFFVR